MRPLPRVHAIPDASVLAEPDLWIKVAAIAAAGPAVALHARNRDAPSAALTALAQRMLAHARPPEAAVVVNGRPDIARAVGAHGVQLRRDDLSPRDAREALGTGWIGASVHTLEVAHRARDEGADYLMVGQVYRTSTHPDRPAGGLELIEGIARLGLPVIAIGGITADRVSELRNAGAYGEIGRAHV